VWTLARIVPSTIPKAAPISGERAKVAPPIRPNPIAYAAQAALASPLYTPNRPTGSPTDPDVVVVAVRP
jgi:hypothetical protein